MLIRKGSISCKCNRKIFTITGRLSEKIKNAYRLRTSGAAAGELLHPVQVPAQIYLNGGVTEYSVLLRLYHSLQFKIAAPERYENRVREKLVLCEIGRGRMLTAAEEQKTGSARCFLQPLSAEKRCIGAAAQSRQWKPDVFHSFGIGVEHKKSCTLYYGRVPRREEINPHKTPHKMPSLAPHKTPSLAPHKTSSLAPHKTPSLAPHKTPSLAPCKTPHRAPRGIQSCSRLRQGAREEQRTQIKPVSRAKTLRTLGGLTRETGPRGINARAILPRSALSQDKWLQETVAPQGCFNEVQQNELQPDKIQPGKMRLDELQPDKIQPDEIQPQGAQPLNRGAQTAPLQRALSQNAPPAHETHKAHTLHAPRTTVEQRPKQQPKQRPEQQPKQQPKQRPEQRPEQQPKQRSEQQPEQIARRNLSIREKLLHMEQTAVQQALPTVNMKRARADLRRALEQPEQLLQEYLSAPDRTELIWQKRIDKLKTVLAPETLQVFETLRQYADNPQKMVQEGSVIPAAEALFLRESAQEAAGRPAPPKTEGLWQRRMGSATPTKTGRPIPVTPVSAAQIMMRSPVRAIAEKSGQISMEPGKLARIRTKQAGSVRAGNRKEAETVQQAESGRRPGETVKLVYRTVQNTPTKEEPEEIRQSIRLQSARQTRYETGAEKSGKTQKKGEGVWHTQQMQTQQTHTQQMHMPQTQQVQTAAQLGEQIQRTVTQQLDAVSEQIYAKLERKMESERRRRGC